MSIKILLCDDHKIFREGLRSLIEKQPDMKIIAEAGDGRSAVKLAKEKSPNIVIMDIAMPELNGIEAARQITKKYPEIKVLILSMYSDRRFVLKAMEAGASGYLLKDSAFDELISGIRTVLSEQIFLSPAIASIFVKSYVNNLKKEDIHNAGALTDREREVLQLLSEGKTTKQVALILDISIKTVETHRQKVMEKLKISSIAELTKYAIREGLTSLD
jgi:DNA-binding NarL/FixJ family response regulator